jgi:hypothetical protein
VSSFQSDDPEKELENVWPDGTWNFCNDTGADPEKHKAWKNSLQMDDLTRDLLYKTFLYESVQKLRQKFGVALNPGMFGIYREPVPAGWKPSEKAFKKFAVKENKDMTAIHYIVARLKHLGNLLP